MVKLQLLLCWELRNFCCWLLLIECEFDYVIVLGFYTTRCSLCRYRLRLSLFWHSRWREIVLTLEAWCRHYWPLTWDFAANCTFDFLTVAKAAAAAVKTRKKLMSYFYQKAGMWKRYASSTHRKLIEKTSHLSSCWNRTTPSPLVKALYSVFLLIFAA